MFSSHVREVNVSSYGIQPGLLDCSPLLKKLLEDHKGKENLQLVFNKGNYHFYPEQAFEKELYISNHSDKNPKKIAFLLESFKNLTIEGNSASFIFHGEIIPFEIFKSENTTLRNFSINWERPAFSQGTIETIEKEYFDFRLHPDSLYEIKDKRLFFCGEDWGQFGGWMQAHDGATGRIKYNTGDGAGLEINIEIMNAEAIEPGLVRLHFPLPDFYNQGDAIVIRHLDRDNPAVHVFKSKDTLIESTKIHCSLGMGIIGQRSENISIRHLSVSPPPESDRLMTTFADGTHFSGCKGIVSVTNSEFEYMFDDAINVHGTYVQFVKKSASNSLIAKLCEPQSLNMELFEQGDKVNLVDSATMLFYHELTVQCSRLISKTEIEISFIENLPFCLQKGDAIDNTSWFPEVIFSNNSIKKNRARGVLINSSKKTLIENNYIQTSGSPILIAGDCNHWFESGPVGLKGSLKIRNNIFDACLTNLYQFTHAQISIDPEIEDTAQGAPCYHRDIHIEDNLFKVFDAPILFARSVKGLHFKGNTIETIDIFKPFHYNSYIISLEACKQVKILGNDFVGEPVSREMELIKMIPSSVDSDMKLQVIKR